jgi:alpha-glucan,water dikinase
VPTLPHGSRGSMPKGLTLEKIPFCGKFTVPLEEFEAGVVGAKARNTKALNEVGLYTFNSVDP